MDTAGEVEIGFNYGRRISRPYYADLNPFLSPLDKFTYNTGNPYLLPSYSNRFEVYYNGKHIYADLFYSYVKDKVDGLIQIVNGYYYNRPGNIGNTYTTGLDFEYVNNLGKWCKFHLFSRLYEQETITSFYTGRLDTKGVGYYIRPVFTFNPGKKWTLQADGYYQSKLKNEQFVDADKKQVNFAVSKQFSAVTLKLAASDIFRSLRTDWTIGYLAGTQAASYRSNIDSRTVVLSLSYRFGKTIKNQRKHEANGAQSEQNRVRN